MDINLISSNTTDLEKELAHSIAINSDQLKMLHDEFCMYTQEKDVRRDTVAGIFVLGKRRCFIYTHIICL